jgi:ABC-type lipoprotein export system ATPase subunit
VTPALAIRALRFRYHARPGQIDPHSDPWTLTIGDFALAPAQHLLLSASSGRGKSTLLHLIAGLLDPDEGRIEIAGTPIHSLRQAPRDRFRGQHIGMIFQTFNLLQGFTALENVQAALMFSSLPQRDHAPRARSLLDTLEISRPNAPVEQLSVGQQQRVAVARAVAVKPTIVLADEPTASLDPQNAHAAMDLIQQACTDCGAALLCVSHDPSIASRFQSRRTLEDLA